jgi:DNA-binding GntR family transcriptional regulator
MLAAELTRRACQRVDDALLAELREHHAAYERAVAAGDRPKMENANWAFHKAIHERAAAPKLALVLRNTLRFFPDFSLEVPGWEDLASRWQSQVMKAMNRGECDKAADAASKNVRQAAELFVTYFEPGG